MTEVRTNWTRQEIEEIYNRPLLSLVFDAAQVHRANHMENEVQVCTLLSIKTGGCPEDCAYCPQAARYSTDVNVHKLLDKNVVLANAQKAKDAGSTRFCMGAAWREVRDNRDFDKVVEMVKEVNDMGLEVCATLGMINEHQASRLKEAGLYAYNHNLDTSEEKYGDIISTRGYDDRLDTLGNVRKAGLTICSGGIIGLGEDDNDRIGMLQTLANMDPQPESVPINKLVAVEGTPLEDQEDVHIFDMVRMIATARILMPKSMVRLSAGRLSMTEEGQAMCFMAGANSIFAGDKLLTTPNPAENEDMKLFAKLGLNARESFKEEKVKVCAKHAKEMAE
ncbi:biotin synthase BioB [Luteibaculum oceani]|uniref:Biotin synthase n=1 Tax=Luteibaculum oceani TaxID=1294296 RepID=A0A5C6UZH0_9FLAO|nr:biotin synthase BioB [Luteibaculum oceani]TXC78833.1 biotin synthase BioB [Luteibaculum oceani]